MAVYTNHDDTVPTNTPIWAFAYVVNDDVIHVDYNCKPTKGEIYENNHGSFNFAPYEKGTNELEKPTNEEIPINKYNRIRLIIDEKGVDWRTRCYSDTEDEAIDAYNKLVQERIDILNKFAAEGELDKID